MISGYSGTLFSFYMRFESKLRLNNNITTVYLLRTKYSVQVMRIVMSQPLIQRVLVVGDPRVR